MKTIYETAVIPKALYGCETWTLYSQEDILRLERAHRFCVKYIQNFPRSTNTEFTLCTLNITSIEVIIDYRKLQFFGQLCRLPSQYLAKQIFIARMVRFVNIDNQHRGIIPDIFRVLRNTRSSRLYPVI